MLSEGPSDMFDKVVNTPLPKTHENEILFGLNIPDERFKEAVAWRCSLKLMFLKISQNSQEKVYSGVKHWYFLVNFVKALRTSVLWNI